MKKLFLSCTIVLLCSISLIQCKKANTTTNENKLNVINSNDAINTIGLDVSLTFKAGHDSKDCNGLGEYCPLVIPQIPFLPVAYVRCHIPCTSFGSNCEWTVKISKGVANQDGSHHAGNINYNDFSIETDTIFIIPHPGAPTPYRNVWKNFSVQPSTSGNTKYININAQNTDIRYTSDTSIYYVLNDVTYTASPAHSEVY